MNILGVRIDNVSRDEALDIVENFLEKEGQFLVFTPNPEMLVDAQKDSYFKEILNASDLNICDGKGIELVAKGSITRIAGVDFMQEICRLAELEAKTVYLLGSGNKEVVEACRKNLQKNFPNLKVQGIHPGGNIRIASDNRLEVNKDENESILQDIILASPDILFVAFGHGKQEKWIYEFLPELPSVKVAMGVGGSFDYIAGKVKRAPRVIRLFGFEWFFRLMREPRRIKRIWKAFFVFLFYSFFKKQ